MKIYTMILYVALAMVLGVSGVQAANKKPANDGQVKFVEKLLTVSSAAQKVRASNDPSVQSLYRAANELYQRALKAMEQDDRDAAGEALFYSTETMFRAVRLINNDNNTYSKEKEDFQRRLDSVNALLDALERVSAEKGTMGEAEKIRSMATTEIASAELMMEHGQPFSARKTLDAVYVEVKTAISGLRSGDTLVRSLHFETKKEEYLYELDRNDTHKMLVTLLLDEKMKNSSTKKRIEKYLAKAEELRKQAEQLASEGKYEEAISVCEDSTKQYVRAIRNSGFYIPG